MKFQELYNQVESEFDAEIALCVIQIMSINLLLKPKVAEMMGEKSFEERIIKKAKKLLWEVDADIVEQSIQVWNQVHDWETHKTLQGLGGCEYKTFKQLLGAE
jgi:hypothetical protein